MTQVQAQVSDSIFRSYNSNQARKYSTGRLAYAQELYETILQYHTNSAGRFDHILDVGCGPGKATRDLAPTFRHATGVDPSEEMVETARDLGGITSAGHSVQYHISAAEKVANVHGIQPGEVDLLTAATAVKKSILHLNLRLIGLNRHIGSRCPSSGNRQPVWFGQGEQLRCGRRARCTAVGESSD